MVQAFRKVGAGVRAYVVKHRLTKKVGHAGMWQLARDVRLVGFLGIKLKARVKSVPYHDQFK